MHNVARKNQFPLTLPLKYLLVINQMHFRLFVCHFLLHNTTAADAQLGQGIYQIVLQNLCNIDEKYFLKIKKFILLKYVVKSCII